VWLTTTCGSLFFLEALLAAQLLLISSPASLPYNTYTK
jgi:hypothetical protein